MTRLANSFLTLEVDARAGVWAACSAVASTLALDPARLGAVFRRPGERRAYRWDGRLVGADLRWSGPESVETVHGRAQVATAELELDLAVSARVEFALPEDRPFLLWRVTLHNTGPGPVAVESIDLAAAGAGDLRWGTDARQRSFFSNGYQSWSFTGALRSDQRQPPSLFGPLGDPKRLNLSTLRVERPGHLTSEMFGVLGDRQARAGLLVGFVSQREQFGEVEVDSAAVPALRLSAQCDGVRLAPGGRLATDWAYLEFINLDQAEPLGEYTRAVARANQARVPPHAPVGWCSWYFYLDAVTERDMLNNLEAVVQMRDRLPLEFVQLDDGFQAQVGDWFETNAKFPGGLRSLAERIRARAQTPGLWLAPYIVRSDAALMRTHPDWLLRDARGRLVTAGYNWFRWCYALDPTHPEVRAHTRRLITLAVREWGFPYLKLDFLYAAALPAQRHDPALTRAQAMRLALEDIRAAAGLETFLLGCGCPLGPAVGIVDGMRISTDVAPSWRPELFTPMISQLIRHEMDFPCVRSAIRNTITRAPLHRRWWLNDPDCLLVRDHDTRLTEAEVCSLATVIALSGGMFLVSDDMRRLSPARARYIAPLLPVLTEGARAPGWMESDLPDLLTLPLSGPAGDWLVAGVFNWDDRGRERVVERQTLGLEAQTRYHVADFWEGSRTWLLEPGEPVRFDRLAAHGAHLLAVRRVTPNPTLVSSSFHFSQGAEIHRWEFDGRTLRFGIELGRTAEGEIRLWLPTAPRAAWVEADALTVADLGAGIYGLELAVNRAAEIRVEL
jgi:alpha-galactosidase